MCRDHRSASPPLDDGPQLGQRELLVDRIVELGKHATGRAHLDQPGVAPQLLPNGLGAFVRAVGQPRMPARLA